MFHDFQFSTCDLVVIYNKFRGGVHQTSDFVKVSLIASENQFSVLWLSLMFFALAVCCLRLFSVIFGHASIHVDLL